MRGLSILENTNKINNEEIKYLKKYIYKWLVYTSSDIKKYYFEKQYEHTSFDSTKIRKFFLINFSIK